MRIAGAQRREHPVAERAPPPSNVGGLRPNKAAVTIAINTGEFTPFHANATCAIRPQSLIGERYVDCEPGSTSAPALTKITSGPGAGTYYLPVTQTSSPIDSDIVQNIYQEPIRERFAADPQRARAPAWRPGART